MWDWPIGARSAAQLRVKLLRLVDHQSVCLFVYSVSSKPSSWELPLASALFLFRKKKSNCERVLPSRLNTGGGATKAVRLGHMSGKFLDKHIRLDRVEVARPMA